MLVFILIASGNLKAICKVHVLELPVRLTLQTDYALRMLIRLALVPGQTVTIERIATEYRISRNHLMKVAMQLNRLGYIETVRGRSGGLRLTRPSETITVGEVVVAIEPDMALVACFHPGHATCRIMPACRLREALADAMAAFVGHLNQFTLRDLAEQTDVLGELLGA